MSRLLAIAAVLLNAGASVAAPAGGARFTSAALHLTMRVPAGWRSFAPDPDTISLARPPMEFHGPIQPRGQARIAVGPSAAAIHTVAAALAAFASEGRIVSTGRIDLRGSERPCDTLERETIAQDVVPPENKTVKIRDIITTVIACATPGGVVVGTASVWEGDPQRGRATADLLTIMRGLRAARAAPAAEMGTSS